jgi:predicted DNA-binding transcriptional regulator AlpA
MEPNRHDGHKPDEHPEFLTKKQVAELLQCSQRQVELLTNKRRISRPIYLGSSSPRWKRAELFASLEANSQNAGDKP